MMNAIKYLGTLHIR